MSDLISRKALLEDMKHFCRGNCRNCDYSTFLASDEHCGLIDRQPTAYDVKAVVKQLEDIKTRHFLTMANTGDDKLDLAYEYVGNALDTAIEIVKGGTV